MTPEIVTLPGTTYDDVIYLIMRELAVFDGRPMLPALPEMMMSTIRRTLAELMHKGMIEDNDVPVRVIQDRPDGIRVAIGQEQIEQLSASHLMAST